jgi:hypothetical protein
MNLTTLSTEQLQLYQHEVEGVLSLLEDVVPTRLQEEDQEKYKTVLEQAYTLGNRITFEIGCRQLTNLQTRMETEQQ